MHCCIVIKVQNRKKKISSHNFSFSCPDTSYPQCCHWACYRSNNPCFAIGRLLITADLLDPVLIFFILLIYIVCPPPFPQLIFTTARCCDVASWERQKSRDFPWRGRIGDLEWQVMLGLYKRKMLNEFRSEIL